MKLGIMHLFLFENYLLLRCKIDQKDILIGAVYGPNTNNVTFYRDLKEKIEGFNIPTVIGGTGIRSLIETEELRI
jgi:hypothetical protein